MMRDFLFVVSPGKEVPPLFVDLCSIYFYLYFEVIYFNHQGIKQKLL